jgi:hypothetical protein
MYHDACGDILNKKCSVSDCCDARNRNCRNGANTHVLSPFVSMYMCGMCHGSAWIKVQGGALVLVVTDYYLLSWAFMAMWKSSWLQSQHENTASHTEVVNIILIKKVHNSDNKKIFVSENQWQNFIQFIQFCRTSVIKNHSYETTSIVYNLLWLSCILASARV